MLELSVVIDAVCVPTSLFPSVVLEEVILSFIYMSDEWETASEDSDGSDGSWIDVKHSSDEAEAAGDDPSLDLTVEEREQKAAGVSQSRIITQDEFQVMINPIFFYFKVALMIEVLIVIVAVMSCSDISQDITQWIII